MNYWRGLKRRLKGKDGAWWDYFHISFDDSNFYVIERRIFGQDKATTTAWRDVTAVCFVDGGQGSDALNIYTSATLESRPVQIPTEGEGGQAFWEELKRRELFPQVVFEQAVTSSARGNQIWWPPLS